MFAQSASRRSGIVTAQFRARSLPSVEQRAHLHTYQPQRVCSRCHCNDRTVEKKAILTLPSPWAQHQLDPQQNTRVFCVYTCNHQCPLQKETSILAGQTSVRTIVSEIHYRGLQMRTTQRMPKRILVLVLKDFLTLLFQRFSLILQWWNITIDAEQACGRELLSIVMNEISNKTISQNQLTFEAWGIEQKILLTL